jgi:hypothetical protein
MTSAEMSAERLATRAATVTGDVTLMPIADVVAWLANRRMSVTLSVRRGQMDTKFVIREGLLCQASSSDPREYLGQHLINFGYIDEDQLQKAFETQQETHVPLGRVLVMVDAVTQEQLARVLLFKTRESMLEAMCWVAGEFRVGADVDPDTDLDNEVPIDLREVHSEGQARAQMWSEIRKVFPSDATRCEVKASLDEVVVSSFDRRLLEVLKAGRSIGEASLELRSMDFQIYARLYDLYNRGVIEPLLQAGLDEVDLDMDDSVSLEIEAVDPALAGAPAPAEDPSLRPGTYRLPAQPAEPPGVTVPAEASDPAAALRIALAGRNWNEALLLAERILELDPQNAEAIAARRVADVQVRKLTKASTDEGLDLGKVPLLAVPRGQLAKAHLTSKERYVLSRIDGRRTLQQIAAVSPVQRAELVRIVQAFVSRGTVTLS